MAKNMRVPTWDEMVAAGEPLWQRWPGETRYELFTKYLDTPPHKRDALQILQDAGLKAGSRTAWNGSTPDRWHWAKRAEAWDQHLATLKEQNRIARVHDHMEREAQLANKMLIVAEKQVETMIEKGIGVPTNTLAAFINAASELARKGMGVDEKGGPGKTLRIEQFNANNIVNMIAQAHGQPALPAPKLQIVDAEYKEVEE